jgi:acetyl esterase/lipase
MFYPVTNADFNTCSYREFACDYFFNRAGMMWFWKPVTSCDRQRCEVTASPLRATLEELRGLPDAMVLNGEADVLATKAKPRQKTQSGRSRCHGHALFRPSRPTS